MDRDPKLVPRTRAERPRGTPGGIETGWTDLKLVAEINLMRLQVQRNLEARELRRGRER